MQNTTKGRIWFLSFFLLLQTRKSPDLLCYNELFSFESTDSLTQLVLLHGATVLVDL
jgi:hypothetical protein